MKRVLLLKAVKQSEEDDIYVQTLSKENYDVSIVSPLSFKFTNLQQLAAGLQQPSQYSGIIFSSPRTVEAAQKCLPELGENGLLDWKPLPAYCVGQATANFVRDQLGLNPVGEQSGNAQNLVQIILEGIKAGSKPLLFPCGTLRRETIPESLQKAGIDFQAHVVYETIAHPDLENSINQYFDKRFPECIVFFSPSGVRFSKEYLAKYEMEKIQAVEDDLKFGTPPSSANNPVYETSLPLKANLPYYHTSHPSRRPLRCPSRRCPAPPPPPPRSDASSEEVMLLRKQLRSLSVEVAFLKQALGMKAATDDVQQNNVTEIQEVINPEHAETNYLDAMTVNCDSSMPFSALGTEKLKNVQKSSLKKAQFDEPIYETIKLPSSRCHSMYIAKPEPPPVPKTRSYTVKRDINTVPEPHPVPMQRSVTLRKGIETTPEPRPVPMQRSVTVIRSIKAGSEPRPVPKERSFTAIRRIKAKTEPRPVPKQRSYTVRNGVKSSDFPQTRIITRNFPDSSKPMLRKGEAVSVMGLSDNKQCLVVEHGNYTLPIPHCYTQSPSLL